MFGQDRTLVDTDNRTAEGIMTAIREGETTVQGRRTPYRVTLKQVAGSVTRRTQHQRF